MRTDVVVRSTLASREDGIVDTLLNIGLLVLAEEDETSTGTAKSLVAVYMIERVNLGFEQQE